MFCKLQKTRMAVTLVLQPFWFLVNSVVSSLLIFQLQSMLADASDHANFEYSGKRS